MSNGDTIQGRQWKCLSSAELRNLFASVIGLQHNERLSFLIKTIMENPARQQNVYATKAVGHQTSSIQLGNILLHLVVG